MSALDTHINMHLASYKMMKVQQLDTKKLLLLRKIGASNRNVGKISFLCQVVNQGELSHFMTIGAINWELSTLIWQVSEKRTVELLSVMLSLT